MKSAYARNTAPITSYHDGRAASRVFLIDQRAAAGFTFFTIDPSAQVDPAADIDDKAALQIKYAALPWPDLTTTARDLRVAYVGKRAEAEDRVLDLDEATLLRVAAQYGGAVAHVAAMYWHLLSLRPAGSFELETSVDETETPTAPAEHLFIARELRRLGVRWVSLAPRYVSRFEKGVDYASNLAEFEADFAGHAAIARALGPYKLSLHTSSDKFSIYGIAARLTEGLLHLKTAGTSYFDALRAIASFDLTLFREILALAVDRFETDKVSYHISAALAQVPCPETLSDARQSLHVTFGSALSDHDIRSIAGPPA